MGLIIEDNIKKEKKKTNEQKNEKRENPTTQFWSNAPVVFPETASKHGQQKSSSHVSVAVPSGFVDIPA